jgi:predicted membrane protein
MNKKKIIFDAAFIIIAGIILIILVERGLVENYIGFALIPILIAYYFGQYVERKTKTKSE